MSAWKLVEAVPEVTEQPAVAQQTQQQRSDNSQADQRQRTNRPRRNQFNNGRTKQERSYYAYLATQQIDSIFHPDSLCMDTYIRSYMDEEGYVPIALVCTYQNVAYFGSSYEDIFHKLIQVEPKAQFYELDQQNETIRPKVGWEKFRMPNVFGGFGLPKYVKQPFGSEGYYGGEGAAEATAASAEVTTGADNGQN